MCDCVDCVLGLDIVDGTKVIVSVCIPVRGEHRMVNTERCLNNELPHINSKKLTTCDKQAWVSVLFDVAGGVSVECH